MRQRSGEEEDDTKKREIGIATLIPYFAALGVGFILIELALLQKLILLMGNPTMTFALLLFTLLISSGAGSLLSSRIAKNNMKNLVFVIGGIAALGILYVLFLPSIIYSTIAEPFEVKAAVSIAILAPIGFLMGMDPDLPNCSWDILCIKEKGHNTSCNLRWVIRRLN
jgi:predicted membrane-bound spermidine synthase